MANIVTSCAIWGLYAVITTPERIEDWNNALSTFCPELRILPYWGTRKDREILRTYWKEEHLYTYSSVFHIVLTTNDILYEDLTYFKRHLWHLAVYDTPSHLLNADWFLSIWPTILSLPSRQRIWCLNAIKGPKSHMDARRLVQFLFPSVFGTPFRIQVEFLSYSIPIFKHCF